MAVVKILLWIIALSAIFGGIYYIMPKSTEVVELHWAHQGSAKIFTLENGIPYIKADNRVMGNYAMGYVTASHRRWQMEYLKRISQGRFSELLGNTTFGLDESFRTIGLKNLCEDMLTNLDAETKIMIEAYIQGVNDYSGNHTLPMQFHVLRIPYEEWKIIDSCTVLNLMNFMLSADWGVEIVRDYFGSITEDEDFIKTMLPFDLTKLDKNSIPIINDEELKNSGFFTDYLDGPAEDKRKPNATQYVSEIMNQMVEDIKTVSFEGSNAWVVSGKHTKSRKPLIVNDPHLGNSIPSIWHYSHIEYPDEKFLSGATVPGMPFYAIFANHKITVTITAIVADVTDIYEEKIVGDQYEFEGKMYPLKTREEIIKVKGHGEKKITVRETRHGPILPSNADALSMIAVWSAPVIPKGDFSISWAAAKSKNLEAINQLAQINHMESANEVLKALRKSDGMIASIIFADNNGEYGNIGFAITGAYPIRKNSNLGHRISRGWVDDNEWKGIIAPEDKPYVINPTKGFIVMANNQVTTKNSRNPIGSYTPGTARAVRISHLLEKLIKDKSGQVDYDDMMFVLNDVKDLYAIEKKSGMIASVRNYINSNPQFNNTRVKNILRKIEKWDGDFNKEKKEPVYFTLWDYFFRKNFITAREDMVKMKMVSMTYYESAWIDLYSRISKDSSYYKKYCKEYNEKSSDSCQESLAFALAESISFVNDNFNNSTVSWGDIHKMAYPNVPFTRTPLRSLFDRYVPAGGNSNTVNVAAFRFFRFEEQMFNGLHSANLKFVSEMNGTIHYSIDTGISESILSSYYFNMNERHLKNDLYSIHFPETMKDPGKPDIEIKTVQDSKKDKSEDL